ncbi:MAG: hypothetical protein LIR50_17650 [Bacillota bacterium]|nr:hypothetical protein [Bacillota bacterium]
MKILKSIIFWILSIIGIFILTIGFFVLITVLQEKIFIPKDYIIWIFKSPLSRLVFIFELYIIFGFFLITNKDLKILFKKLCKKRFIAGFAVFNIFILYTLFFNVSVIKSNEIIDYRFLSPQGVQSSYNDIVLIDTGVYGKKMYLPFTHSKGDFYYIIKLKDGTKIDLAEMGGSKDDQDPRFIIEKLDSYLVDMGVSKSASMENFEYCTKNLDKIYTDKIQKILKNVK